MTNTINTETPAIEVTADEINTETPASEVTTDGLFDKLIAHREQLLAAGWDQRSILDGDKIGATVDIVEDLDQLGDDSSPKFGDKELRGVLAAVGVEDGEGAPFRVDRDPVYERPMLEYRGPLTQERVEQLERVGYVLIALTHPPTPVAA